jgi:hypothetical protein
MEDHLCLEIRKDEDGTAELFATVQVGSFAGHSSACFNQSDLVKLGQRIEAAFPIKDKLSICGGFWSKEAPGELEEEHLAISFYSIGNRGQVGCQVRLASLQFNSHRHESKRAVQVELELTYAELQRFGRRSSS